MSVLVLTSATPTIQFAPIHPAVIHVNVKMDIAEMVYLVAVSSLKTSFNCASSAEDATLRFVPQPIVPTSPRQIFVSPVTSSTYHRKFFKILKLILDCVFFLFFFFVLQDIDECTDKSKTHNCDRHATCKDTNGSFTCHCNGGYKGTGTTCSSKWMFLPSFCEIWWRQASNGLLICWNAWVYLFDSPHSVSNLSHSTKL